MNPAVTKLVPAIVPWLRDEQKRLGTPVPQAALAKELNIPRHEVPRLTKMLKQYGFHEVLELRGRPASCYGYSYYVGRRAIGEESPEGDRRPAA
jgi:hypothetical protein